MTRLYGFTYNWVNRFVVGFGKRCLCIICGVVNLYHPLYKIAVQSKFGGKFKV